MSDEFVKHGSAPGAAAAEAAYLRWLREGSAAVVEVLMGGLELCAVEALTLALATPAAAPTQRVELCAVVGAPPPVAAWSMSPSRAASSPRWRRTGRGSGPARGDAGASPPATARRPPEAMPA